MNLSHARNKGFETCSIFSYLLKIEQITIRIIVVSKIKLASNEFFLGVRALELIFQKC